MQLSVVILNYNVRWFLQLCLESVSRAIEGMDAEIIVVDNNSADDSCQMVRDLFPKAILVENKENLGFPKGNNLGVAQAKGEYVCILNPDTVVAEDTFRKVLSFAKSQENLGIVGCKLIDGTGKFLPESKRGIPTPFVAFGRVTNLYKLFPSIFGKYYALYLNENETGEIEILVGAFMVMRRETYLSAGGFDEDCFMYSDDIDLSYTVLKSGKKNFYFADSAVIHFKGESTVRDGLYMKRFREAMNFFYRKHFRISPVFDLFMKLGTFAFSFKKRKNSKVFIPKPQRFALVPADSEKRAKSEKLLGKNFEPADASAEKKLYSSTGERTQFWLDSTEMKFSEIIAFMQANQSENNTFRILVNEAAIGSDSSSDRGEVLVFGKQ